MIRVDGHTFWRGGDKIGFIDGDHIKNHEGDKVGYVQGNYIYDIKGHKLAYMEADHICFLNSPHKIRIEDNDKEISGGDLSNIQKAAVRVLLGE